MKTLITITLIFISGCTFIHTDHATIITLFKSIDTDNGGLVADPNGLRIGAEKAKTENDKIKLNAVIGAVPVGVETQ